MKKLLVSFVFSIVVFVSKAASFTVDGIYYYTIDDERVGVSVDYDVEITTSPI